MFCDKCKTKLILYGVRDNGMWKYDCPKCYNKTESNNKYKSCWIKSEYNGVEMNFRKNLEKEKIIKNGHFLLSSGKHSNTYINKDAIFSNPQLFQYVIDFINHYIVEKNNEYDVITGPAIAGAILAAPISLANDLTFVYPEKIQIPPLYQKEKFYMMAYRRGYDKVMYGKKILLVEDIITTGRSVQQTIDAVEICDGTVVDVIAIWNRSNWKPENCDIFSIINEPVESWCKEECPDCKNGIPLTDPKTDKILS